MNFIKRTFLSIVYYKKNTLLLISIYVILGILIQSGISIYSNSLQTAMQAKKNMHANIIIKNDYLLTGDAYYGKNRLPVEVIEHIKEFPEVEKCSMTSYSIACGTKDMEPYYDKNVQTDSNLFTNQFRILGCNDINSINEFKKDNDLIKGRNINDFDRNVAIISADIAQKDNIELGSFITLNPYYKGSSVRLLVIGIYKVVNYTPRTKYPMENSENLIITDINTIFKLNNLENIYSANFQIENPDKVDLFVKKIHSLKLKDDNQLTYIIDTGLYDTISSSIKSINNISMIIVISSIFMCSFILLLLAAMQFRDRYYEIGVLLSLGESKYKIILQIILEILIPVLISTTIAVFISYKAVYILVKIMGGNGSIAISLHIMPVLLMYACSILITIIASLNSIIKIILFCPRKMLISIQ